MAAMAMGHANPNLWSLDLDLLPRNPWRHPHTAKVVHEINLTPHLPRLAWLDPAGYETEDSCQLTPLTPQYLAPNFGRAKHKFFFAFRGSYSPACANSRNPNPYVI
ncbi:uncharacterized protein TrAFT101_008819 [Trichoderma asperellum]|uniref:uncharacterized protein n=1 Tax=Trichoderma asperellum TaxID=101201 RepID=UPI003326F444|nr:hypothetical protein TrAFT101_008819 [Trichoderma asperellum]